MGCCWCLETVHYVSEWKLRGLLRVIREAKRLFLVSAAGPEAFSLEPTEHFYVKPCGRQTSTITRANMTEEPIGAEVREAQRERDALFTGQL